MEIYRALAAGLESGQLGLWDPAQITHQTESRPSASFNPPQHSLLPSGGTGSERYLWDPKNPTMPYRPGTRSRRLDGVSYLAWNAKVAHILASSNLSGYTVVWDLRGRGHIAIWW
ncbi:protein transport protein S31 [Ceratobasidium sp. 414]|nr:protein transport protein S31 [Ceratobasidium sp. 414]